MQTLRRQGRNFALQLLYQADIDPSAGAESRDRFWKKSRASKKGRAYATQLAEAALEHRDRIDVALRDSLTQWKIGRLPVIVRSILRLATCELLVIGEEPAAVVINEAIELTRTYMDEESVKIVNSVLDKVRLKRDGGSTDEPRALESG